ncbi:MAG TPA: polysaccharide deacetylase family protein [Edaphobacter sp.]|nr:polysaccharide deacetylase family protein [Edaphobacter sp.]
MPYRKQISRLLSRSGFLSLLELLPTGPGLVVFNHHRIGDLDTCEYDRNLFSASVEQFDYQLSYIKRHFPVLLPYQLAELRAKGKQLTRLHVMITFDDGYLDNYTLAFKLLKQHNIPAAFFLVSTFVGTAYVPWWDEIAYLVRHSPLSSLAMMTRWGSPVDLKGNREGAVDIVLRTYKMQEKVTQAEFLRELRAEAQVALPTTERRFLNWKEAEEMQTSGMEIGAHTHTHPFLSSLSFADQQTELCESKTILDQHLRRPVASLAYPNGSQNDFTPQTQQIAREAGYTTAFSYYGGVNRDVLNMDPYDVLRNTPNTYSHSFRTDMVLMSRLGKIEPTLRRLYRHIRS